MTPRERLSRSLAALRVAFGGTNTAQAKIAETVDDLEVMAMHSEWPALRTRALSALTVDAAKQAQA